MPKSTQNLLNSFSNWSTCYSSKTPKKSLIRWNKSSDDNKTAMIKSILMANRSNKKSKVQKPQSKN